MTVAALAVAHYLVAGVQTQLIQFLAEWGPETALLVAFGPVTALHLISAGLGWGRGAPKEEQQPPQIED